jgi:hypothetical protein
MGTTPFCSGSLVHRVVLMGNDGVHDVLGGVDCHMYLEWLPIVYYRTWSNVTGGDILES